MPHVAPESAASNWDQDERRGRSWAGQMQGGPLTQIYSKQKHKDACTYNSIAHIQYIVHVHSPQSLLQYMYTYIYMLF